MNLAELKSKWDLENVTFTSYGNDLYPRIKILVFTEILTIQFYGNMEILFISMEVFVKFTRIKKLLILFDKKKIIKSIDKTPYIDFLLNVEILRLYSGCYGYFNLCIYLLWECYKWYLVWENYGHFLHRLVDNTNFGMTFRSCYQGNLLWAMCIGAIFF